MVLVRRSLVTLLLSTLALAACGGKHRGLDGGISDGSIAPGDGTTGIEGPVTTKPDVGVPTADGPQQPDAPAVSPYADDFFPMAVGLEWKYQATKTDGTPGTACSNSGTHSVAFTSTEQEGGGTVYIQSLSPGCYTQTLKYRRIGAMIDVYSAGAWYHALDLPPQQGKSWAAGGASGASYTWEQHYPTYQVAAGNFSDCWKRKQNGYEVWEIYCKGVGMVLSHYAAWGGDARQELTWTNVP